MKRTFAMFLALVLSTISLAGCSQQGENVDSQAQDASSWPEQPIEVIIPYSPGGDTDFNARAFTEYLTEELGVPVVCSNVTGSSGTIASRQVKDANPDGYTALFFHTAINVNEMVGIADFGLDDFELSCISGMSPGEIITVRSDLGVSNLYELKAYTEEHPGELDLAIDFGTMVHINGLQMQQAGIDVNLVTAGSATERVAALAGGHCDIIINAYGTIKDYLTTGEFVALGTTGSVRASGLGDIPTCLEQGYDINLDKHYFFAFPKGTPSEIVEKFAEAIESAEQNPEYQESIMTAYAQDPFYASPEEGKALMEETKEKIWEYQEQMEAS